MHNKITRLRGDTRPVCRAHRAAMLRQRHAAAMLRLARQLPLHFPRFLQFVSPSVATMRIKHRATLIGRRN
ncbi:hypothetical protein OKW30_007462 [Paraburkholderia sp. Clong3]|uniref:hypothetical protein n=1 Tax=unclassified Paraburkholderia TaxID=2615204 RepID=UPI001615780F|nr:MULTISPECIES: hypothetical protein [unclassified Paraburkholderia]MBB5469986.1 hypothetical protein [Paraburkholderia sp. CI2]MBC8736466.1 hypothetical protein [Paraburkholderia sp. UCT31]